MLAEWATAAIDRKKGQDMVPAKASQERADRLEPITGASARFLFAAKDNRGIPGSFDYWVGPNGHMFLDPVPQDLDRYYQGGYQEIPQDEQELAEVSWEHDHRLELVQQFKPAGTFLEIGSWIGMTAYCARRRGYQVSVLERDGRCVDLIRRSGIDAVQTSDPAKALCDSGHTYDVIGMWHSLEHLPKPWEVLELAAERLNPGGLLLVSAPNPESSQFRLFGKHWMHLDAPRHIHFLPLRLVEEIAEKHGLQTVFRTTDDKLGQELDEYGWRWELHRRVRRIFGVRALAYRLFWRRMKRKHRTAGMLDGASFTVAMMKVPLDTKNQQDRPPE